MAVRVVGYAIPMATGVISSTPTGKGTRTGSTTTRTTATDRLEKPPDSNARWAALMGSSCRPLIRADGWDSALSNHSCLNGFAAALVASARRIGMQRAPAFGRKRRQRLADGNRAEARLFLS